VTITQMTKQEAMQAQLDAPMVEALYQIDRLAMLMRDYSEHKRTKDHSQHYACPERAAVKRASLDTTKALAKLRKVTTW